MFRDVCFVAAHMRSEDAAEIYCQLPEAARSVDVAALSCADTEHAYCAWVDGSPVAAFGFSPATPAAQFRQFRGHNTRNSGDTNSGDTILNPIPGDTILN